MKRIRSIKPVAEEPISKNVKVLWKNAGGGSFRLGRKIIKPGETFEATDNEISENFRDVLHKIGGSTTPIPVEKEKKQIPGVKSVFRLRKRPKPSKSGNELYDVVSDVSVVKDGEKVKEEKPLNTKGLTEKKANELLKALNE